MSFSGSVTVAAGSSLEEIHDAVMGLTTTGNEHAPIERAHATHEAKKAAAAVIESGALGRHDAHAWFVSISGHVNPGHEKTENWAQDCVTVSINQIAPGG
jgi:hypothetical protein